MVVDDNLLFLHDSYLRECSAKVVSVKDGKFIVFDRTVFYPRGGGQPCDTGIIEKNGEKFHVVFVGKFDGVISHEVDRSGLNVGDAVTLKIDWERRYVLMRMHTSAHVLSAILHRDTGALVTGNDLGVEKSHIDFSLESSPAPDLWERIVREANEVVEKDVPVTFSFVNREDALKDQSLFRLAKGAPSVDVLRIVQIGDVDKQADGGTQVKSTKEIGRIVFLKCDNKGKGRKRLYFGVE